jgi:hypothetical protein
MGRSCASVSLAGLQVRHEALILSGVKGGLPLGCLPLRGRDGVTLIPATEDYGPFMD